MELFKFIGISALEIIVILLVILAVVGPDNLIKYARKLGGIVRNFRR